MSKFVALLLGLALAVGEVDARGSTRDTTLATFNTALMYLYPDVETRTSLLIDQVNEASSTVDACTYVQWSNDFIASQCLDYSLNGISAYTACF